MEKTFLVIVNPKSGKGSGRSLLQQLEQAAGQHHINLDVRFTDHAGHAEEIAARSEIKAVNALVAIGGDGTLHEVVNGLASSDNPTCPIGLLPGGTGNSLATDLNLDQPKKSIQALFSENTRLIDLFEVRFDHQLRYGFNMLGCGLPARINEAAENSRTFKGLRYEAGVLKSLFNYRPEEVEVRFQDSEEVYLTDFCIAANTRIIGNGIRIAPDARLDDGLLDVLTLSRSGRRFLIPLWLKLMQGKHLSSPDVSLRRTPAFSVQATSPQPLNLDGETYTFTKIDCRVSPGKCRLLCPPPREKS